MTNGDLRPPAALLRIREMSSLMREEGFRYLRFVADVVRATVRIWLQAQVFVHAGALAFFTIFSVAPIVIVAITLVGLVFGESAAHGELVGQLQAYMGVQAAELIQTAVENSSFKHSGVLPITASVAAMLFGATTVFAQMQGALNVIWGVAPRPTRSGMVVYVTRRLLSLSVVLGIGCVLLVSMALSVALRAVLVWTEGWLPGQAFLVMTLDWTVSLLVMTLLFAAIFKILPDVLLSWRDVFLGAFVTALLFVFGRALIALYLSTTAPASTYGAAGSLVMLLLWVNYSSLILFLGAAFTRAQLEVRGGTITPRKNAVSVQRAVVDTYENA